MKKILGIIIAIMMAFALVACGEQPAEGNKVEENKVVENKAEETPTTSVASSQGIKPATDGTLTISKADVAIVVNGTSVKMPYKLKDLESAGVPADESRDSIELKAGDFYTGNVFLDENQDYLLIPAYYNGGDSTISILDAEATEITMSSYSSNPVDQGVSILGVSFGTTMSEARALLGEPSSDDGSYLEWHIEIPDMNYEGTLSMYLTGDTDDSVVSQVNLNVFEK